MRPREVEKILTDDGWIYKTTKGSHKHFVHPTKPGKVTVPQHPGDTIDKTLLNKILKQAGLQ
ncbi:MAG: type II toxin-antitoxin system HicA family toxin [Lawsonibacter sp.]